MADYVVNYTQKFLAAPHVLCLLQQAPCACIFIVNTLIRESAAHTRSSSQRTRQSQAKRHHLPTNSLHPDIFPSPFLPVMDAELNSGDHILSSGLRRIRQKEPVAATALSTPSSPLAGQEEDFARFPNESLHSFSFAYRDENAFNARQNVIKKSMDFLRNQVNGGGHRLNWETDKATAALSQARNSDDKDVQSMVELLEFAQLIPKNAPLTGPADVEGNPFDEIEVEEPKFASDDQPASSKLLSAAGSDATSSRSHTHESFETSVSTPPTRKSSLRRTYTDLSPVALQVKLIEALSRPYVPRSTSSLHAPNHRYSPNPQAVFTTEPHYPWTILSANDLACLVFGVTKDEIRKIGIVDVVKEERRDWLCQKLCAPRTTPSSTHQRNKTNDVLQHSQNVLTANRGVILCGDVVPIQKRNGDVGTASLWVKEKKNSLIWVLEEVNEDFVLIDLADGVIEGWHGDTDHLFGKGAMPRKTDLSTILPTIPLTDGRPDKRILADRYYTAQTTFSKRLPCKVELLSNVIRVSSFPHIAGIIVISAKTFQVTSFNAVFSASLFGAENLTGRNVQEILPQFLILLEWLREEDKVKLVDGIVIPEHSFRRAQAVQLIKEGKSGAAAAFLRPAGVDAKHRDGSNLKVDVQMRVVCKGDSDTCPEEMMYALWITYAREIHAAGSRDHPETATSAPMPTLEDLHSGQRERADSVSLKSPVLPESSVEEFQYKNKTINDFTILENIGSGAYGHVRLARPKATKRKVILKYVTKKRILVDTWTRDRKLGTVPLEIHVLNYLKGHPHANIMEMTDFFEDDKNYYIEMPPHGVPGMDLFDYIELRVNMDEDECRSIFVQVVRALLHLHSLGICHRDIKDENVVLDGEGRVKLIDFGSAAYTSAGPWQIFCGTVDYAAPEVLAGHKYTGKPQDVWAAGILLYTMIYKENPFYNVRC